MIIERENILWELSPVFTERMAIKEAIQHIQEERRRLTDQYWSLISRLRELDTEDRTRGQFIDIESTFGMMYEITKELSTALHRVQSQIPMEPIISNTLPIEDNKVVDKETVLNQKEEDRIIKTQKHSDLKKISGIVAQFLKERGVPVKLSTIFAILEEQGYTWSKNAYSLTIKNMMEHDNKIVTATRGYYQYKI
jgi:hypothetical protein